MAERLRGNVHNFSPEKKNSVLMPILHTNNRWEKENKKGEGRRAFGGVVRVWSPHFLIRLLLSRILCTRKKGKEREEK